MENLRFNRREGSTLIFSGSMDREYSITANQILLSEVRTALRPTSEPVQVKPADIQRLLRSGKTVAEVADLTEADTLTIERYAAPVLSELSFMLNNARNVLVSSGSRGDDAQETFGEVIDNRLREIGAKNVNWSSYRDDERRWIVRSMFKINETEHIAEWVYEQQKNTLTPFNPDAVELSKQGSVGEALIPRLRVLPQETTPEQVETATADSQIEEHPFVDLVNAPKTTNLYDFSERQVIEEQAIRSEAPLQDLGETQDLLAQLRQRRSEREMEENAAAEDTQTDSSSQGLPNMHSHSNIPVIAPPADPEEENQDTAEQQEKPKRADLWANLSRVAAEKTPSKKQEKSADSEIFPSLVSDSDPEPAPEQRVEVSAKPDKPAKDANKATKRGRSSIPSWDDILFGSRKDSDSD